MQDKSIILVFIKAPVRGMVKTRLAASVGASTALELYKNFVPDIIDTVKKIGGPFTLCYYPPGAGSAVTSWLGADFRLEPQQGGDLGERMERAFANRFSEGFEQAVLIGSDIPDIPPAVLSEAISALAANDLVIGPAFDGGYYLIGCTRRAFLPRLFHGIPWGTGVVFDETMTVARNAGLTVHVLQAWHDIDTINDLRSLAERSAGTAFDKSRTMTYLRATGLA